MDAPITSRPQQCLTQEEFFAWLRQRPDTDIHHYELIHGRIVMTPPAGFTHGGIGAELLRQLGNHVKRLDLGRVFDASTGFELPSGDTLEPDVSFVSKAKLRASPALEHGRFGTVVPDLVVEVLSRSTANRDRTDKKVIYAANGVREYWLVDPDQSAVTVYHLRDDAYDAGVVFTAGAATSDVLLGFAVELAELFDF